MFRHRACPQHDSVTRARPPNLALLRELGRYPSATTQNLPRALGAVLGAHRDSPDIRLRIGDAPACSALRRTSSHSVWCAIPRQYELAAPPSHDVQIEPSLALVILRRGAVVHHSRPGLPTRVHKAPPSHHMYSSLVILKLPLCCPHRSASRECSSSAPSSHALLGARGGCFSTSPMSWVHHQVRPLHRRVGESALLVLQ